MDLSNLFGYAPSYLPGLLGEEQARLATQQAQQQGLLGAALGLMQAGAPSRTPVGLGQSLAQGLAAGQQAYSGALQQRVQEQMIQRQVEEQQRLLAEQKAAQSLLPQILTPGQQTSTMFGRPTVFPTRDEEGNVLPGAGVQTGQPQINFNTLQALLTQAPSVAAKVLPTIEAFRKMTAPERVTLGEGQTMFQVTPEGLVPLAGGPREQKPAGEVLEAMQVLGINVPVTDLSQAQRSQIQNYIDRKEERKAPKVSVDLNDPTAVAKAQSGLVGDWRGVLKDVGAMEIADRYSAAVNAVRQGNAGNKAADGALIYAVGKIYDPSGAVQEGDKATILGNRSIPDRIRAVAESVFKGQTLLPSERNQLLSVVTEQVKSRADSIERQRVPYATLSAQLGGNGSMLLNPLTEVINRASQQLAEQPTSLPNVTLDAIREERARRDALKRGQ